MVDVKKCTGCRKGISLFIKEEDYISHLDLFMTPEAGGHYRCGNSVDIEQYLVKNEDRGTFLPNEELKKFLKYQRFWWEDIISICHNLFENNESIEAFFINLGDNRLLTQSNLEIENDLLTLAEKANLKITQEDFPDLIKWR